MICCYCYNGSKTIMLANSFDKLYLALIRGIWRPYPSTIISSRWKTRSIIYYHRWILFFLSLVIFGKLFTISFATLVPIHCHTTMPRPAPLHHHRLPNHTWSTQPYHCLSPATPPATLAQPFQARRCHQQNPLVVSSTATLDLQLSCTESIATIDLQKSSYRYRWLN